MIVFFKDVSGITAVGSAHLISVRVVEKFICVNFQDISLAENNEFELRPACAVIPYDSSDLAEKDFKAYKKALDNNRRAFVFQAEKSILENVDTSWEDNFFKDED